MTKSLSIIRGGAVVARVAYNHEVAGSIPAPVTKVQASFFPAVAWPTRVKHTDTNSARLPAAAGVFSGAVLSAGRVISGASSNDGALPSRTARARLIFSRFRNGVVARVLTGTELNAVRLSTMRTSDDVSTGFGLQLPPLPALSGAGLAYGLRLAWLLGINGGLR